MNYSLKSKRSWFNMVYVENTPSYLFLGLEGDEFLIVKKTKNKYRLKVVSKITLSKIITLEDDPTFNMLNDLIVTSGFPQEISIDDNQSIIWALHNNIEYTFNEKQDLTWQRNPNGREFKCDIVIDEQSDPCYRKIDQENGNIYWFDYYDHYLTKKSDVFNRTWKYDKEGKITYRKFSDGNEWKL